MGIDFKYPLEMVEENLNCSALGLEPFMTPAMSRRLKRVMGSHGIIKIVAEIGDCVRVTRYKRKGEK